MPRARSTGKFHPISTGMGWQKPILINKKPEYQLVEKDYLENEITRFEKRINHIEDRINCLGELAHSI
jgi:hypothetical protein